MAFDVGRVRVTTSLALLAFLLQAINSKDKIGQLALDELI